MSRDDDLSVAARALPPAAVTVVTFLAFLPCLGHDFVSWDDAANFLENPHYRGLGRQQLGWMLTSMHLGHYTPLSWLTLGLDYLLWGMDPRGYHLSSLAVQTAAAVVFYFVALRLLRLARPSGSADGGHGALDIRIGAMVAALLFGAHPLRVESVAWVTERRDVLSGLLFLGTVLAYLKAVEGGRLHRAWYGGSLALFAGSLLSKASTMPLPFVLLVLDVYPLRRLGGERGWRVAHVWLEKLPYAALAAVAVVMAFRALATLQNSPSLAEIPIVIRAIIGIYGLAFYVLASLLPVELSPLYQVPLTVTWLHFAVVIAGAIGAIAGARRWPAFSAAAVVYVLLLLPVLRLVQGGPQMVADRYSYLSCLSWAVLGGAAVAWRWRGTRVTRAVAFGVILVLAGLTWQQTGVWRSSITLWTHVVTLNPESRAAYFNLGHAHSAVGHVAAAVANYEETMRRSATSAPYHVTIGEAFERAGLAEAARDRYVIALREQPALAPACRGLKRLAPRLDPPPAIPASCAPGGQGTDRAAGAAASLEGGALEARGHQDVDIKQDREAPP